MIENEKFYELPIDKQNAIINGGLNIFSKYEYKKATMEEIAKKAGISKALLFHYFGNKKKLYLFLYDYSIKKALSLLNELKAKNDTSNDFFDKVINAQKYKMKILLEHPDLMLFLFKAYLEKEEEINKIVGDNFDNLTIASKFNFYKDVDFSKFKEDVSPEKALNIILWMAEGFMKGKENYGLEDFVKLNDEFVEYIELLKRAFYKEEYL